MKRVQKLFLKKYGIIKELRGKEKEVLALLRLVAAAVSPSVTCHLAMGFLPALGRSSCGTENEG